MFVCYVCFFSESTHSRVLYFSIFSMCCLMGLATWQVVYLRRFFKAKKLIEWKHTSQLKRKLGISCRMETWAGPQHPFCYALVDSNHPDNFVIKVVYLFSWRALLFSPARTILSIILGFINWHHQHRVRILVLYNSTVRDVSVLLTYPQSFDPLTANVESETIVSYTKKNKYLLPATQIPDKNTPLATCPLRSQT